MVHSFVDVDDLNKTRQPMVNNVQRVRRDNVNQKQRAIPQISNIPPILDRQEQKPVDREHKWKKTAVPMKENRWNLHAKYVIDLLIVKLDFYFSSSFRNMPVPIQQPK